MRLHSPPPRPHHRRALYYHTCPCRSLPVCRARGPRGMGRACGTSPSSSLPPPNHFSLHGRLAVPCWASWSITPRTAQRARVVCLAGILLPAGAEGPLPAPSPKAPCHPKLPTAPERGPFTGAPRRARARPVAWRAFRAPRRAGRLWCLMRSTYICSLLSLSPPPAASVAAPRLAPSGRGACRGVESRVAPPPCSLNPSCPARAPPITYPCIASKRLARTSPYMHTHGDALILQGGVSVA